MKARPEVQPSNARAETIAEKRMYPRDLLQPFPAALIRKIRPPR
jgi:hypothetical protein